MKEIIEFRINNKYAHLLLNPNEGKYNGSNTIIHISKNDPKFEEIRILGNQIREKDNDFLFLYSNIKREYSKKELDNTTLLCVKIKTMFEPAGEECGTEYDETTACKICGANRKKNGPLLLKKGSIPQKDIARTIAGEIVVSKKFVVAFNQRNLKGLLFEPVLFNKETSNYYELIASEELDISSNTVTGVNIFDSSESVEAIDSTISGGYTFRTKKEVYKCPEGHTIGLNLLSELYILNSTSINKYDFFITRQKIGVKRGLLRPEPQYLCSASFRKMVEEEGLSGFDFEIAHIE